MNTHPVKTRMEMALEMARLTPEELARRTQISPRQIRYYIAGKGMPRIDRAIRIARELGISNPADLFPSEAA